MANVLKSENENFQIEISDDNFSAYLTVLNNEAFLNEKEFLDLIDKSKIVYGFERANELIKEKNIKKEVNLPFPLVIGEIPKPPEIEFSPLFNNENCYEIEFGEDLSKLKHLKRIEKGEPLAHLFVTKQSHLGVNIFGDEVVPEEIENQIINQHIGDNVEYSMERGQIIASKAGYPYIDSLDRICVKSLFTIDKDINESLNGIDFFGDLLVIGDISEKIKFSVNGELTVNGNIADVDINVKGDIIVNGDILNCKTPGIFVTGKIQFHNAENSKIISGDRLNFSKNIHFCKILAENGIYGNKDSSSIVGGICQSGENIEVAIMGNTGGIGTEIEIAISPFTKEKMLSISKQLLLMKDEKQNNTIEYLNLQDELTNLEMNLEDKINVMIKNIENLPKHIMAYKKVFHGTYVRILKKSKMITEDMNAVNFSIVNSELTCDQY